MGNIYGKNGLFKRGGINSVLFPEVDRHQISFSIQEEIFFIHFLFHVLWNNASFQFSYITFDVLLCKLQMIIYRLGIKYIIKKISIERKESNLWNFAGKLYGAKCIWCTFFQIFMGSSVCICRFQKNVQYSL